MPDAPDAGKRSAADSVFGALREARSKFMSSFPERCDRVEQLLRSAVASPSHDLLSDARGIVHRLSGLAGTVGFPTVSVRASELESLIETGAQQHSLDVTAAIELASALRTAFATDLRQPPAWAGSEQS